MANITGTEFETHDPDNTLTKRQSEVLVWIAEGKGNDVIATILGITVGTVKFHIIHLLRHFDAPNRQLIISRAFAKGLIRARHLVIMALVMGSAIPGAGDAPFTVRTPRVSQVRNTRRRDPDDNPVIEPQLFHALFNTEREAA